MTVANYREMLKCTFGENVDRILFVENFINILAEVTSKDVFYLRNISLVDIIYLVFDIYNNSIGSCKITVTQEEKTLNVELDLSKMKELLFSHNAYFNPTVEAGPFKIVMETPSLERVLEPAKYAFLKYIKGIQTDTLIPIKTNKQAATLIQTLTPQVVNLIASQYESIISVFSQINFLSIYGLDDTKFNFFPTFDTFLWLVKLLFGDSLSQFYENFFYLSYSGKFNAEFVEKISVGEFNYFIGLLKHTLNPPSENELNATPANHDVGLTEM
jgi:hypothetical protein